MIRCLNIGCGSDVRPSGPEAHWTNVDWREAPGVTYCDLQRTPWYFTYERGAGGVRVHDETFDYVLADNVLEHFDNDTFIRVLNEIDRVVKIGGRVEVVVPHAFSQGAYQDPTHKMFFVPRSALYWNQVQTPFGGLAVGITANLACDPAKVEVTGDMRTEAFIRFKLTKLPKEVAR